MRALLVLVLGVLCGCLAAQETAPGKGTIRFRTVDIYIDPQGEHLAAYQLEFQVSGGGAKIVGIEGGEHAAFVEPPFFDPKALQHERVILAGFNTSSVDNLPNRKTRVATLHLQVIGDQSPRYALKAMTAGTLNGKKIKILATFEERKTK